MHTLKLYYAVYNSVKTKLISKFLIFYKRITVVQYFGPVLCSFSVSKMYIFQRKKNIRHLPSSI